MRKRKIADNRSIGGLLGGALLCLALAAGAQRPLPPEKQARFPVLRARLGQRRPLFPVPGKKKAGPDAMALRLLQQMVRSQTEYTGEQVTEVTANGGHLSRQRIWGDKRGRVRRDFLAPQEVEGDVMLIGPEQFRHYRRRENAQFVAFWPVGREEIGKRMLSLIRSGRISVARVGQETIAGRDATIVLISADGMPGSGGRQIKFWIDTETGISLKQEISNAGGLLSRTYMTSIQIGPDANITPALFEPAFVKSAVIRPLFPPTSQFASVEEARERLPFTPLQPGSLPQGFRLNAVWAFGPEDSLRRMSPSVLLRYSDGVSNFVLYQRQADRPLAKPALPLKLGALRRPLQRWQIAGSDGKSLDVLYIGHLAPLQVREMYDSLR